MSPQPPDFNRLLAEGRTYAYDRFRPGCVVTVRTAEGADLRLPSGRVIAVEPAPYPPDIAETLAFVQRVAPGSYPVQLVMADYYDPGNPQGNTSFSEVAAARLLIRDEPVRQWRLALQDGQDDSQLAADEFYAYAVDGGTGSFASPEVFAAFADEEVDAADDLITDISFGMYSEEACVYTYDRTGNNLVAFRSGGGDGRYGTWVGYTAEGEVACFVTDFGILSYHEDDDDDVVCDAGAPSPAAPLHRRRGPASHATGAQMLVGQTLSRRQSLTSSNGAFVLVYQDDGNLVLYPRDGDRAVWASGTHGCSAGECVLQEDGNLVVYDREGRAVWATGTDGRSVTRLTVHDNGVLALRGEETDEAAAVVWSTGAPPPARPLAKAAAPPISGRQGAPLRPAAAGVRKSRSVPAGRAVRKNDT
ncbi:MAG TPA: DUF4241 domain-containing protein [Actinospica sp.]|nr:DUF4241 domain-containing protein [Actinospica sp.]